MFRHHVREAEGFLLDIDKIAFLPGGICDADHVLAFQDFSKQFGADGVAGPSEFASGQWQNQKSRGIRRCEESYGLSLEKWTGTRLPGIFSVPHVSTLWGLRSRRIPR